MIGPWQPEDSSRVGLRLELQCKVKFPVSELDFMLEHDDMISVWAAGPARDPGPGWAFDSDFAKLGRSLRLPGPGPPQRRAARRPDRDSKSHFNRSFGKVNLYKHLI